MASIEELNEALAAGRMAYAVEMANDGIERWKAELSMQPANSRRLRGSSAVAEVLVYVGRNREAAECLAPWATEKFGEMPKHCSARVQLLGAEFIYGQRQFEKAAGVGLRIYEQCHVKNDPWGAGHAAYFLSRCHMRLHRTERVYEFTDRALDSFSRLPASNAGLRHWRIGLVLLVGGFSAWQANHPSALGKLLVAKACLAESDDPLAKAHVESAIGNVHRSVGERESLQQAMECFTHAKEIYERWNHPIHLSQVLTNIGRTEFAMQKWSVAATRFQEALDCAETIRGDEAKNRQKAETFVHRAWLHKAQDPRNISKAYDDAVEAEKYSARATRIRIEALLVRGTCCTDSGQLVEAEQCLDDALAAALDTKLSKLIANAYLCLADLYSRHEIRQHIKAVDCWLEAQQILQGVSTQYLSDKARRVKRQIDKTARVWMVDSDELIKASKIHSESLRKMPKKKRTKRENRFRQLRSQMERWLLERLEEDPSLTQSQKADILGISQPAYSLRKKELPVRKRRTEARARPSSAKASDGRA